MAALGWLLLLFALCKADVYLIRLSATATDLDLNTSLTSVFGNSTPGGNTKVFRALFKGFAANLTSLQLNISETLPNFNSSTKDIPIEVAQLSTACTYVYNSPLWGRNRVAYRSQPGGPAGENYRYSTHGGSYAYIVDSGIRLDHAEFSGRAEFGYKADSWWDDLDNHGHGTRTASVLGGATIGVAPAIEKLIAVKVIDFRGGLVVGYGSYLLHGLEWILTHQIPAGKRKIINISIQARAGLDGFPEVVKKLMDSGILVVLCAGNFAEPACWGLPGGPTGGIVVGATGYPNSAVPGIPADTNRRATYSSYGTCVDVFAPGTQIIVASTSSTTALATDSGTSFASPNVAGIAAMYWAKNPTHTPYQIKQQIILNSRQNVTDLLGSPNRLAWNGCFNVSRCYYNVEL